MVNHIAITKARINLGQLAKRVHINKEYFILEKDGIPVAGLMDADELEDYLELQDSTVKEFIAESHKEYIGGHTRPAEQLLGELKQRAAGKAKNRKRAKV